MSDCVACEKWDKLEELEKELASTKELLKEAVVILGAYYGSKLNSEWQCTFGKNVKKFLEKVGKK